MVRANGKASVAMGIAKNGFLLLQPGLNGNADEVAKAIAMCRGVKEVYLTTGEYGFVVTTKTSDEASLRKVGTQLRKVARDATIHLAINHYEYRRTR